MVINNIYYGIFFYSGKDNLQVLLMIIEARRVVADTILSKFSLDKCKFHLVEACKTPGEY